MICFSVLGSKHSLWAQFDFVCLKGMFRFLKPDKAKVAAALEAESMDLDACASPESMYDGSTDDFDDADTFDDYFSDTELGRFLLPFLPSPRFRKFSYT